MEDAYIFDFCKNKKEIWRNFEILKVICANNKGGYEKYKADITQYMSELFDNVKSAFVYFMAEDMDDAKDIGEYYFSEEEVADKNFNYDGDEIEIEFWSGKIVQLDNSE